MHATSSMRKWLVTWGSCLDVNMIAKLSGLKEPTDTDVMASSKLKKFESDIQKCKIVFACLDSHDSGGHFAYMEVKAEKVGEAFMEKMETALLKSIRYATSVHGFSLRVHRQRINTNSIRGATHVTNVSTYKLVRDISHVRQVCNMEVTTSHQKEGDKRTLNIHVTVDPLRQYYTCRTCGKITTMKPVQYLNLT